MFPVVHSQLDHLSPLGMSRPELEAGVAALAKLEAHAVERRLAFLTAIDDLCDGGVSGEGVNRSRARRSKRSSKTAAATGKALALMPNTRRALANGEINEEHANTAADAAERTSAEEADEALLPKAKAQPADLFAKKAREWASARERESMKAERFKRQQGWREASTWTDDHGMTCLFARFDPVIGKQIINRLDETSDRFWRADGGREGTPDHPRTPDQRRADALAELITGSDASLSATKRPHPKYTTMVGLALDRLSGENPDGVARILDGEPLPESVLQQILCDSAIAGAVYAADGAVMWQGRAVRLATDDQWNQLVVRDGGCVGCGASPAHCEAHHISNWEDLGTTDIDNLVLVCPTDHHLIHSGSHELIRTEEGWELRRKSSQRRQIPEERAA